MKKATGACIFVICVLPVFFSGKAVTANEDPDIKCDRGNSCNLCYKTLVDEVLSRDSNMYNLTRIFFSPYGSVPVFVTVRYHYDMNDTNYVAVKTDPDTIYFWSSAIYFFFHPVNIFQFTSLLFSDPALRTETVDLHLDVSCNGTNEQFLTLLTQRLKLYAMHQKFTAPVDDTYNGRSYSSATLKTWYNSNRSTDILALASQILFPSLVMLYIFFFFVYVLELKPYEIGKDIEREMRSNVKKIKAKADAKLLTKLTISLLFHLLTLAADGAAFVEYRRLSSEIHEYYYASPKCFWSIPIVMILFDGFSFLAIYIIFPVVALGTRKWYRLTYCLLSPLACFVSHSYHIIFAFVNDPYHATSILLLYAIIVFVHVLGFQKVFYLVNYFWDEIPCGQRCAEGTVARIFCKNFGTFVCFIIQFIFIGISIGLSLALLTLLPISNAIDDAPNRLYVIYQASVTFFAALIAFQVIFRQSNSPFSFLIKAKEVCDEQELDILCQSENWTEKSEKEREIYLVQKVISAIQNLADQRPPQLSPNQDSAPQALHVALPNQGASLQAADNNSEAGGLNGDNGGDERESLIKDQQENSLLNCLCACTNKCLKRS